MCLAEKDVRAGAFVWLLRARARSDRPSVIRAPEEKGWVSRKSFAAVAIWRSRRGEELVAPLVGRGRRAREGGGWDAREERLRARVVLVNPEALGLSDREGKKARARVSFVIASAGEGFEKGGSAHLVAVPGDVVLLDAVLLPGVGQRGRGGSARQLWVGPDAEGTVLALARRQERAREDVC